MATRGIKLPFGLDLMTIIITLAFVFFVLPWIMGMIGRRNGSENAAA